MLTAVIFISFISLGLPDSMFGAAWPSMHTSLGVSVAYAGIISAITAFGTVLSSLLYPRISRKASAGIITGFSIILTTLACFGFSIAPSFPFLIPIALVLGVGAGSVDVALNNYASIHFKPSTVSLLHAFWGIGTIIGPFTLSLQLSRGLSWRMSYVAIGFAQAAIAVLVLSTLGLWAKEKETDEGHERKRSYANQSGKNIKALYGAAAFFSYSGMENMANLWIATFLVSSRGFTETSAAAAAGFLFWGITTGRLISGAVSNRFGDKLMLRAGEACTLLSLILLFVLPKNLSTIAVCILGVSFGPIYPSMIHQTSYVFGVEYSAKAMSIEMAASYVGCMTLPPLFGILGKEFGMSIFPVFILIMLIINTASVFAVQRKS